MNRIKTHFHKLRSRTPWSFCWRVALEGTGLSLLVGTILSCFLGAEPRSYLDLPFAEMALLLVLFAPLAETLFLQLLPILLARLLRRRLAIQVSVSTLLFALAHFLESPLIGISVGIVGGFYFALTYAHWAERSHWTAYWVTAVSHFIRNAIGCLMVVLTGEVPIVEPDYWYSPATTNTGKASETQTFAQPAKPYAFADPPVDNERRKLAREAALAPDAVESDAEPKTLFVYAGTPYTVQELTFVGYQHALAKVKSTQRYYLPEDAPRGAGYVTPGRGELPPDKEGDLVALYHHQLDGVIVLFAVARIFELLKQEHPADITGYYDATQVEAFISVYAETIQRFDDVRLASAKAGDNLEQFADRFMAAFPDCEYTQSNFETMNRTGGLYNPAYLLNHQCFPRLKDGRVIPWLRNYLEVQLVQYHVQALVEADKPRYIRFLENQFGRRQYFVVQGAKENEFPEIARVINSHVDARGVLTQWHAGMRRINRELKQAGLKAMVKTYRNSHFAFEEQLKILPEEMRHRAFMPFSEPVTGQRSYLYFVQEDPDPHFREYSSAPGRFLYDLSKRVLLRPLAEKVLSELDVPPPFTKPTVDLVLNSMSTWAVPKGEFGVKYPQVVRE